MAVVLDGNGWRVKVCGACADEQTQAGKTDEQIAADPRATSGEDRYAAGAYAGHYCDRHWAASGYRQDLPNLVGGMTEDEIEAFDNRDS